MQNDLPKIDKQKAILNEFMKAQYNGFISGIDIELKEKSGKIIYDPDAAMYRNNEWDEMPTITCQTYLQYLDSVPTYKTLHIRFSDRVTKDSIAKIKDYVSTKYGCNCIIHDGRMTIHAGHITTLIQIPNQTFLDDYDQDFT